MTNIAKPIIKQIKDNREALDFFEKVSLPAEDEKTQEIIDSNRNIDNQLRFSNMIGMYQIIQMDNIKDFVRRYW